MKRAFRSLAVLGLTFLMVLIIGPVPSYADDHMDLGNISVQDIMTRLQERFDAMQFGSQKPWAHRLHRNRRCPDPNDFEYLLSIDLDFMEATDELPGYWKIAGELFPEIKFELWLPPKKDWNKKFFMAGCGGFCGGVDTNFPAGQFTNNIKWGVLRGYASATTDSGHDNLGSGRTYADWALDNRRGEIDWGYRAIHEVTRVCKALICMFYHRPAKFSYFAGCSTGGRQAIMEALKFPEDFDGVISGAPALNYTGLVATWMSWIVQASDGATFSVTDMEAIRNGVLDQCDLEDGVEDGLISDPRRCRIDLSQIASGPQLEVLEKFYAKPTNSLGKNLYPGGIPFGSEIYWPTWVPGVSTTPEALGLGLIRPFNDGFLKFMAFQEDDPAFMAGDFDFDAHPSLLEFMGEIYNSISTDLIKYKKMGGKIIMYHGWADSIVPPAYTIDYYERVVARMGNLEKTQEFFRLFMVPGMDHCSTAQGLALQGLPFKSIGLDDFDALEALEKWVEKGITPEKILASGQSFNGEPRARYLFPYPLYAKYIGGDPNNPNSFVPENDGSVRWGKFRNDTFYAFEIESAENNPVAEGEGLGYFQPYDHELDPGIYYWRVWSPSMFDEVDYPGYHGEFTVEAPY